MRNNRVNMILLFFVVFLVFVIFSVQYSENFEAEQEKLHQLNKEKENKNVEKFKNSAIDVNTPFSVYNLPKAPSQNRQFLNNFRFDYPSVYDDPYRYPNTSLPPAVIGCGGRRGACMGGSQVPIPNTLPPINISEQNIAPINLTMRGFDEGVQQVGTIQKVFGKDNLVYPLFGRKRYRNDNKWDYFVKFGDYGVILPIVPLRNYEELNTNDQVYIQGQKGEYRVTIYDDDIPQYLPFA